MSMSTAHTKTRAALSAALGVVSTAVGLIGRAFALESLPHADTLLEPRFLSRLTSPPSAREVNY
ncbi:MAG: hypothetical protein EHM55_01830 [Acidobacteria bacterium]|nr:MAG: hypothetical protein EHM55_01830 [Acidobacteriota bacterium]